MRIYKYTLGILLCLLPSLLAAQTLTQYEYWFDGDVANSTTVSMGGSSVYINPSIPTDGLSDGIHLFSIRVKQSGGQYPYSPVYSSYFFKHNPDEGAKIEYWFDDYYNRRATMDLPAATFSSEGGMVELDMNDRTKFPQGIHRLNMRMSTKGKSFGPVTSATVLKLPGSAATTLEYWVDDDYDNRQKLSGSLSGKVVIFNGDLDLSKVSSGIHRLYYRTVTTSGEPASAVGEMPVMVKSRYVTEAKTSKVVNYSVTIDDKETVVHDVLTPSSEITIPYVYDTRSLTVGKHTVKTKVWNSIGAMAIDKTEFNVVAPEKPVISVEAAEQNGMVTVKFNAIPNDLRYRVFRKDANGNNLKIGSFETSYPNAMTKTDEPVEGTYKYYVMAVYTDNSGKNQTLQSNEATVTVAKAQTPTEVAKNSGSIIGRINIDNKQVAFMPLDLSMDVVFSDGVTVKSQSTGLFIREGIPLGTTLTMTVKNNENYTFSTPSVTVDANTRNKIQVINATPIKNQVIEKKNDNYDLVITSRITGIPNSLDFEVKNTSSQTWTGEIDIMAIKKSDDKKSNTSEDLKSGQVVSYAALNTFRKVGSYRVERLLSGKSTKVSVNLTDMPTVSSDTYYQLYIVSKPENAQTNSYKLLECSNSEVSNPKEFLAEASSGHDYSDFVEDEINACIAEVLSTMKALDKVGGPMSKALEKASDALTKYERDKDFDGMFGNLPELLQDFSSGLKDGIKDVKNVTDYLNKVKKFYDTVNKAKEIANADDFTKFYELSKLVIELSGDPFGKVYMVYLDVAKKAVAKILELSNKLYEYHIANSFYNGYTKFEIKVEKNSPWWIENDLYKGSNVARRIEKVNIYCYTNANRNSARTYLPDLSSSGRSCKLIDMGCLPGFVNEDPQMEKVSRFWMEIEWKSGRKSIAPLLYDEVADITNRGQQDKTYTVTFKSGVSDKDRMDYKIKLKCKDNNLNE